MLPNSPVTSGLRLVDVYNPSMFLHTAGLNPNHLGKMVISVFSFIFSSSDDYCKRFTLQVLPSTYLQGII